jgi:hypothetical protein
MKENLKTARVIHQLIIAISAAVIAFGLSPDRTAQYQTSLKELTSLRQLSFDDYVAFATRSVHIKDDQNAYVAALKKVGLSKIATPFLIQHTVYVEKPQQDAPLAEILRFLNSQSNVIISEYNPDTLKLLPQTYIIPPQCKLSRLILSPNQKEDAEFIASTQAPPSLKTVTVWLSFARYPGDMNCGLSLRAEMTPLPPLSESLVGPWLTSENINPQSFLLATRQILDVVGAQSISEGTKSLEERINSPKKELSFLGIDIPEEIAVWSGPLVTLSFLMFLLAHVRHILRQSMLRKDPQLRTFPWVALFPDSLSRVMTYVSIALIPTIANCRLLVRSWGPSPAAGSGMISATGLVGVVATLAIAITGVLVAFDIHRLQLLPLDTFGDPIDVLREAAGS